MERYTFKTKNGKYLRKIKPHDKAFYEMQKLGQLEDIEEEFLNYNIDMTFFLKQVLNELKQQPTLEISNFNPEFQILRDDFIKTINEYAKIV